jgi:hypothetical protein
VAAVTVDEDAGGPDQISPTLRSLLVRHVPVMPTLGRHPEWAPIPTEDTEPPRWMSTGGAVGHFAGFQGVPVLRVLPGDHDLEGLYDIVEVLITFFYGGDVSALRGDLERVAHGHPVPRLAKPGSTVLLGCVGGSERRNAPWCRRIDLL